MRYMRDADAIYAAYLRKMPTRAERDAMRLEAIWRVMRDADYYAMRAWGYYYERDMLLYDADAFPIW